MKFRVTFKTPDAVEDAIAGEPAGLQADMRRAASRFVRYGEYLTVEFDTETETAEVKRAGK